jgi:hypothetical protein
MTEPRNFIFRIPVIEWLVKLEEVDRVSADRTCGQMENGWVAVDHCGTEYFVAETGEVWIQPQNVVVGVVQELKDEADRIDRMLDEGISCDWEDRAGSEICPDCGRADNCGDCNHAERGIPAGYHRDMALD